MARGDDVYMSALEGKSIPILTLDNKWHQLFTQTEMTPEIEAIVLGAPEKFLQDGYVSAYVRMAKENMEKMNAQRHD